jgi:hypothetical protein
VVPVELPIEAVRSIAEQVERSEGKRMVTVDLATLTVTAPDATVFPFRVSTLMRHMLLEGLDEVALADARARDRRVPRRGREEASLGLRRRLTRSGACCSMLLSCSQCRKPRGASAATRKPFAAGYDPGACARDVSARST